MGTGFLKVQLYTGDYALHGDTVTVLIKKDGEILHTLQTDENGSTEVIPIESPSLENLDEMEQGRELFTTVDVEVPAINGYKAAKIFGVQIFDGIQSNLPVRLEPLVQGDPNTETIIHIPREHGVDIDRDNGAPDNHEPGDGPEDAAVPASDPPPSFDPESYAQRALDDFGDDPEALITPLNVPLANQVVVPDFITVHLGTPSATASSVRVPFKEYIKNVVSSEIYPFWAPAAIEANTHAIVSFTLNRLFTEKRPLR